MKFYSVCEFWLWCSDGRVSKCVSIKGGMNSNQFNRSWLMRQQFAFRENEVIYG